jgi:hypothetical protein
MTTRLMVAPFGRVWGGSIEGYSWNPVRLLEVSIRILADEAGTRSPSAHHDEKGQQS